MCSFSTQEQFTWKKKLEDSNLEFSDQLSDYEFSCQLLSADPAEVWDITALKSKSNVV